MSASWYSVEMWSTVVTPVLYKLSLVERTKRGALGGKTQRLISDVMKSDRVDLQWQLPELLFEL